MRPLLVRSAVVASGLLLLAGSAHATTITIDDTLPGNTVGVTFVPLPAISISRFQPIARRPASITGTVRKGSARSS